MIETVGRRCWTGAATSADAPFRVAGELARIRAAPRPIIHQGQRVVSGGRNNALHLAAFRLGQLAAHGGLDRATIWTRLIDAALDVGLKPAEARRTIASGWRAGLRRPRT